MYLDEWPWWQQSFDKTTPARLQIERDSIRQVIVNSTAWVWHILNDAIMTWPFQTVWTYAIPFSSTACTDFLILKAQYNNYICTEYCYRSHWKTQYALEVGNTSKRWFDTTLSIHMVYQYNTIWYQMILALPFPFSRKIKTSAHSTKNKITVTQGSCLKRESCPHSWVWCYFF